MGKVRYSNAAFELHGESMYSRFSGRYRIRAMSICDTKGHQVLHDETLEEVPTFSFGLLSSLRTHLRMVSCRHSRFGAPDLSPRGRDGWNAPSFVGLTSPTGAMNTAP